MNQRIEDSDEAGFREVNIENDSLFSKIAKPLATAVAGFALGTMNNKQVTVALGNNVTVNNHADSKVPPSTQENGQQEITKET